jgi:protein gp37
VGVDTAIEWADHTFNPWTGCTRVSPGCDHCYAATMAKRNPAAFGSWEPGAPRKRTSATNWEQPRRWNRAAEREGRRMRVFCASMADVFDNQVPEEWRADLWALIDETPHLDWLLLTKRPQNIMPMMIAARRAVLRSPTVAEEFVTHPWPNVWFGTTVENQAEADRRIPELLAVPAAKRFLSCEPLLGPVSFRWAKWDDWREPDGTKRARVNQYDGIRGIHWVIAGGESGTGARPMHPDWARTLRDQCAAAGVPFFFKQWGEWREFPTPDGSIEGVEDESEEADAIYARAVNPGFVTRDGDFIRHREDLPGDGTPCRLMERVGKKAAGRLLDGREHSEVPHA